MRINKKRPSKISVFRNFYFLFALVIVVVYVTTIAITISYARQNQKAEIMAMENTLRYSADNLEQQMEIVFTLEGNLSADARIETLTDDIKLSAYERARLWSELMEGMTGYASLSPSMYNLEVFFPEQGIELSMRDGLSRRKYEGKREQGGTSRKLIYDDEELYMELLFPLTYTIDEKYVPRFGIRTTISMEYLGQILALLHTDDRSGAFLLHNDSGEILVLAGTETEEIKGIWQEGQSSGYQFLSEELSEYGLTLVAYRARADIYSSMMWVLLFIGILLILIGSLFGLMVRQTNQNIRRPLNELMSAFEEVQKGNIDVRISHDYDDEFRYIYNSFNDMTKRIRELLDNVREQGKLLKNAELIQLQSQINPHFLYNSFHLIRIMAKNESYDQILEFVTSLAKYYRFLNKEVEQNVELIKEVEHMQNYINIQQMRFGDKISVYVESLPQEVEQFKVPKLILQPLLENAYNYGMKNTVSDGEIRVSYRLDEKELQIIVEDNGGYVTEESLQEMRESICDYQGRAAGHALTNIERRLKLAYGESSGIKLAISPLGGLQICLQIDLCVFL